MKKSVQQLETALLAMLAIGALTLVAVLGAAQFGSLPKAANRGEQAARVGQPPQPAAPPVRPPRGAPPKHGAARDRYGVHQQIAAAQRSRNRWGADLAVAGRYRPRTAQPIRPDQRHHGVRAIATLHGRPRAPLGV